MIRWEANFQIPNSGTQTKEVFVIVDEDNRTVKFYGDREQRIHIMDKQYMIPFGMNPYQYLLSLDEFKEYEQV